MTASFLSKQCLLLASLSATAWSLPFKNPAVVDSVASPRDWLVVADLNADSHPDLLCAAPGQGLRWWKNNGTGAFTLQPDITLTATPPVAVLACNLDRDNDLDLIVQVDPGNAQGRLLILKYTPNSGFVQTSEILLGGRFIPGSRPLAADVDSDGDLDILQAHQDAAQTAGNDPLSLLLNDGTGSFAAPTTVTAALNWPTALAWHDADENGVPDLIVATTGVSQIRVYSDYSPGAGLLVADLVSSPPAGIQEIIGLGTGSIAVRYDGPTNGADAGIESRLSFEGLLDWTGSIANPSAPGIISMDLVAVPEAATTDLAYITKDPVSQARQLKYARIQRTTSTATLGSTTARAVRSADLDHDWDTDLVLLRDSDIAVLTNESIRPSTELTSDTISLSLPHPPVDILLAADVLPAPGIELVGAVTTEGSLRVFAFDGRQPLPGTLITTAAPGVNALKSGDLDNDGDIDLVFNAPDDSRVKWLRNNGDGTFTGPSTIIAQPSPGPLDVGDVDRDGDLDVAMAFQDGGIAIARNNGANPPGWAFESGGDTGLPALDIRIADIIPGQRAELLVETFAFGNPNNVTTLRLIRHLLLPSPDWYSTTVASGIATNRGIAVADVEPDGDLDVITGPGSTPGLFLNDGNGVLAPPIPSPLPAFTGTRRLWALDLDLNGSPEILGATSNGLLAGTVTENGISSAIPVGADFTGKLVRDVVPLSIYTENDFLAVSEASTPAIHLVRNNRRSITRTVTPAGTPPDLRGGKAVVFAVTLESQAPQGGPTTAIGSLSIHPTTMAGTALDSQTFTKIVTAVDVWRDNGTPGTLDPADVLLSTQDSELNGIGPLMISMTGESLAPQESRRWLIGFHLAPDPVPGLDQIKLYWGGDNQRLSASVLGDLGTGFILDAVTPPVERVLSLASMTPLQAWRFSWWGTPDNAGPAADSHDADADGCPNLVEYALGSNPLSADPSPLTPFIDAAGRQAVTVFLADPPRTDVTITLEESPNLVTGSWTSFASRQGAGAWSGPAVVTPGSAANGRVPVNFADPPPFASPGRFVRLRASQ